MNTERIDGKMMKQLLLGGLSCLTVHEEELNSINVFPVPDGDTGTNMKLTLSKGIEYAGDQKNLGLFMMNLKKGVFLSARGNSGNILALLISGMAISLKEHETCNVECFIQALINGYKNAYESVINPVEGTILTVTREGINNIAETAKHISSFENFFNLYITEMKNILYSTPEHLPQLKTAGVYDSGATGYIIIFEGILNTLVDKSKNLVNSTSQSLVNKSVSKFNSFENCKKSFGSCTEFILEICGKEESFSLNDFISTLKAYGNSLVYSKSENLIKIHIHTFEPENVIKYARNFGTLFSTKIENMDIQTSNFCKDNYSNVGEMLKIG